MMIRSQSLFALLGAVALFSSEVNAAREIPAQGRFYIANTQAEPKALNADLGAANLRKVDKIMQAGVEILYPAAKFFEVGLRYSKHTFNSDETDSNPSTDYSVELDQDTVQGIVRIPFFKSSLIRADVFGGFGGSNTTLKIKTAAQDGTLQRRDKGSWLAAPYSSYGASVGIGYKYVFLVVEGGFENNSISKLNRTGSVTSAVDTLDMSGSYFSIGLLFSGVPVTRKN